MAGNTYELELESESYPENQLLNNMNNGFLTARLNANPLNKIPFSSCSKQPYGKNHFLSLLHDIRRWA